MPAVDIAVQQNKGEGPRMTETTETAPGAPASGGRKSGLNAMLLPELKQLAGGLGIKSTGLRKGDLIEAIKAAQSGGSTKRPDSSEAKGGAHANAANGARARDDQK